jgi:UDP-4-amino-4,6-dideoxy-N-acetyl-beta-L-altrosamine transaminase
MRVLPYGKQNITEEDIQAVVDTLKSDYLTQGPRIPEFEASFAKYVGSKYAVAVANGTAALHLCALALQVRPGTKVITTPITFAASANCIRYCNGDVVFADIDPSTYLIDLQHVEEILKRAPKGTFTGIIPVDFSGRAVDLEALRALADHYGLWIIADACHAPGGYFLDTKQQQQLCGNGRFAELSIFSLHPVKHIAAGEGGVITTNDPVLYHRLLLLRTHGITRQAAEFTNDIELTGGEGKYPGWYMEMLELGYNYRITDFQAALANSQLTRANEGLLRRRELAYRYFKAFNEEKAILGQSGSVEGHAYHLYIIEVDDRLGLYNFLRSKNIFGQVHYFPTHLMPYYRRFGWNMGDFPKAERYYSRCLSLPMFPTLTDEEQDFVIKNVLEFLKRPSRSVIDNYAIVT